MLLLLGYADWRFCLRIGIGVTLRGLGDLWRWSGSCNFGDTSEVASRRCGPVLFGLYIWRGYTGLEAEEDVVCLPTVSGTPACLVPLRADLELWQALGGLGRTGLEARNERGIEALGAASSAAAQPSPVCVLLCCRGHRFAQEGSESCRDSVSCRPPRSLTVRGPALCALTPSPGSEALGAQG